MSRLVMPAERKFGWDLKPTPSTFFGIHQRANGQFCVVLNHSLLRGLTSEMIHWWFCHFQNMKIKLDDVEGYEGKTVPAYYLWHPSDHIGATLVGKVGMGKTAQAGDQIHIQEAMQYKKYGMKYPVDKKLTVFYCESDGWAMGLQLPWLGEAMVLRISFEDVIKDNQILGVHYHYEVVMGLSSTNFIARKINQQITRGLGPDFFEAWHLHNTIEVGVFENFLPALYDQRDQLESLHYSKAMTPQLSQSESLKGHSQDFFNQRMQGYRETENPYSYQDYRGPSNLEPN